MNESIFYFFYNFAHQSVLFDKKVVFLAVYFPYIVILLAGLFLIFYRKSFKELFLVIFSVVLAGGISEVLKILIHLPRPFDAFPQVISLFPETGYAFPSFHATFFAALAVLLFFLSKKTGYIFMLFALLIGLSRIVSGVHFPIDILGGFILGGIVSYLFAFFTKNV